jgi:hypothetical protein
LAKERGAIRHRKLRVVAGVLAATALQGCASARMSDTESDRLFRSGRYEEAAAHLKKGLADQGEGSHDELLYLLDIGLSLHSAGKFEESNQAFLKADKLAEIKDYTSLAKEASTLLVSENTKDYKGEDFEKVMINTYLSMNYAIMGDYENALVEARRVNHKLLLMVSEGERKYKQNAFARYLSAILYEAEGNPNDAYIDYKETYKLEPGYPGLGRDLWRTARVLGISEDAEKWDEEFKLTEADHATARELLPSSGRGEIIVIYENGLSPMKKPSPAFYSIPAFFPRFNPVHSAKVDVVALPAPGVTAGPIAQYEASTGMLENIESTAVENLNEKYAGIIAKKVAGVVAKEVAADQIGRHTDPWVGAVAKLFFYVSDQADTRSWNLLPHDLQIARIPVNPGSYTVQVTPVGSGQRLPDKTIQVGAGRKAFVAFRFMP